MFVSFKPADRLSYSYLFGLYLGDGYLGVRPGGGAQLLITCENAAFQVTSKSALRRVRRMLRDTCGFSSVPDASTIAAARALSPPIPLPSESESSERAGSKKVK